MSDISRRLLFLFSKINKKLNISKANKNFITFKQKISNHLPKSIVPHFCRAGHEQHLATAQRFVQPLKAQESSYNFVIF